MMYKINISWKIKKKIRHYQLLMIRVPIVIRPKRNLQAKAAAVTIQFLA